mgnify:CR=1 FL=1
MTTSASSARGDKPGSGSLHLRGTVISTILRHDAKTTSYKIALLRGINDVALAYPDIPTDRPVAISLSVLARFWLAYYWPFADRSEPIWQGARNRRREGVAQDMAFRDELTALKEEWEQHWGVKSAPADGFVLIDEMHVARRRRLYPPSLLQAYEAALRAIARTIEMPIRYAGTGNWSVFPRPAPLADIPELVTALPGTPSASRCLVVPAEVWLLFRELSLWVEALCIHQWALFTEGVDPEGGRKADRGEVYRLLTDRPDNRRPLTWERNQVDILLLEGHSFTCPWTRRALRKGIPYDMDHLVPVSVHPINELWNLVPTDPAFNQHAKRDRLPSCERLRQAEPILTDTYCTYATSPAMRQALNEDARRRFVAVPGASDAQPAVIARAAVNFLEQIAVSRNMARF